MSVATVLAIAGILLVILAAIVLRSFGPGFRVGRLLGATPEVSIDDALAIAGGDAPRYVRVTGRISSDEEFPDDQNRPLVFRRTRLAVRGVDGQWVNALDEREAVPFGVETRSSYIAVDDGALGDGLVVIARESAGRASDLPAEFGVDLPAGMDSTAPARLTIEQVSAVEQATVVGQPIRRDGVAVMTAGLGRPLIVTTLEQPAAMRVLAHGRRGRVVFATAALALGVGSLFGAGVAFVLGA